MKINMFIDGKWVEALSGARRNIINPANGEVIASSAYGSARRCEDSNQGGSQSV